MKGRHGHQEGGKTASQTSKILKHLQRGWSLTPIQALSKFGCNRLAARIRDLREMGHPIHTDIIAVTTAAGRTAHIAHYSMPAKRARRAEA